MGVKKSIAIARMLDEVLPGDDADIEDEGFNTEDTESAEEEGLNR
jgi:hypothetical protein